MDLQTKELQNSLQTMNIYTRYNLLLKEKRHMFQVFDINSIWMRLDCLMWFIIIRSSTL